MKRIAIALAVVMCSWQMTLAQDLRVTGINAVYRNGQTFVTWKDVAEGSEGAKYRYSLYRSNQPITQESLAKAELCYKGLLNNEAKLFGSAFTQEARQNEKQPIFEVFSGTNATPITLPTAIIEEGGKPLPMWSGVAVHTVTADEKAFYAIVATSDKFEPVSKVEPGQSATTEAVDEKVAPIQPIKLFDSKSYGPYRHQLLITGTKKLPLNVWLHPSGGGGGGAKSHGDYYLYFATKEMGWRDGLPGVFSVEECRPASGSKDGNILSLFMRDAIVKLDGKSALETYWFGYFTVPQLAKDQTPRAYPFTEKRTDWIVDWVVKKYDVDPLKVYGGGQSMGGWGSMSYSFRRPERFAALFPTLPRMRQRGMTTLGYKLKKDEIAMMSDGVTPFFDRVDSVKFASEHHEDLPFLCWSIGRFDGFATWKEQVDMVKALTASHHGFAMAWNNGNHGDGIHPMRTLRKYYTESMFILNQSYPAFGHSSLDNDMGTGAQGPEQIKDGKKVREYTDGDLEGGINLGFHWGDIADEAGKWAVTLSNDLATNADMTVDVTPRRCQNFKAKAGDKFKWVNSAGGQGDVVADEFGLVTVPKVVIKPGAKTTLTITR